MDREARERWLEPAMVHRTRVILDSYRHWLGRDLLPRSGDPLVEARTLRDAPFVVVAHRTGGDPILDYGNLAALELWEMTLDAFLVTPSRLTAEPMERGERAAMLQRTGRDGYIDDYAGVRISSSGRRFRIERAIVWNLRDERGDAAGQAATFSDWVYL